MHNTYSPVSTTTASESFKADDNGPREWDEADGLDDEDGNTQTHVNIDRTLQHGRVDIHVITDNDLTQETILPLLYGI